MSLAGIKSEIRNIILSVTGIENVHEYERWTVRAEKFLDAFKDSNDRINGWEISRRITEEFKKSTGSWQRIYTFIIRGYYGVQDAAESELAFDALIELIADKFRANPNLNTTCVFHDWLQVDLVEPRMFGNILVHYCELSLRVTETLTVT